MADGDRRSSCARRFGAPQTEVEDAFTVAEEKLCYAILGTAILTDARQVDAGNNQDCQVRQSLLNSLIRQPAQNSAARSRCWSTIGGWVFSQVRSGHGRKFRGV